MSGTRRSSASTLTESTIQTTAPFISHSILHDLLGDNDIEESSQDLSGLSPRDWRRLAGLRTNDAKSFRSFQAECSKARDRVLVLEASVTTARQLINTRCDWSASEDRLLAVGCEACKCLLSGLPGRSAWHSSGDDFDFWHSGDKALPQRIHPLHDERSKVSHVGLDTICHAHQLLVAMGKTGPYSIFHTYYSARADPGNGSKQPDARSALASAKIQLEDLIHRYQDEPDPL